MHIVRKILFWILSVIDVYFGYATVGYLVMALNTPRIVGEDSTYFAGMYIMSGIFFAGFLLITALIVFFSITYLKNKKIGIEK